MRVIASAAARLEGGQPQRSKYPPRLPFQFQEQFKEVPGGHTERA
jgi:hypothetical protein